jgi:hypothetical protein
MSPEKADNARPTLDKTPSFIDMVYLGEPGSGKTTAAAHMALLGKVVWVCGEMGLEPDRLADLGIPIANIELHDRIDYDSLVELATELRTTLRATPGAYAGVVFDTFSEIQGRLLEAKAKTLLISQNEYGVNTSELTRLLRKFTDLPCHTAYVTHTKREEDKKADGTAVAVYKSMMTPKVGSTLDGYVRISCHMVAQARTDSDEADYVGFLRPHFARRGKDRTGTLPPKLISPTFDRIEAYVSGRYLRSAMNNIDDSGEVPDGLDPLQFEYRERIRAQKAATEAVAASAATTATTPQEGQA